MPGAAVEHGDEGAAAVVAPLDPDRGVGCGVVQGVLHEVVDHGVEVAGRGAHVRLARRRRARSAWPSSSAWSRQRSAARSATAASAIEVAVGGGLAVLGQAQEVGEQLGQALGLELARHQVALEVGVLGAQARRLQAQAQPGERGAQLMRGVGDEVALGVERAHEPLGHVVEGVGHLDLLGRAGRRGARAQVARGDLRAPCAPGRAAGATASRRSPTRGPARAPARRRRGRAGRRRRGGPRR